MKKHNGKQAAGPNPKANIMVGLARKQGFTPMHLLQTGASGRDYAILVPLNVTHSVVVSSNFFKLADQTGLALAGPLSATLTSLGAVAGLTVQVVGLK